MNRRLIKRLDLIAAGAESKLRDDITRLTATLSELAAQRATLGLYQSRLTATWTDGAATQTATAQRAELFCAAARTAGQQLIVRETQLQSSLETALQNLAGIKQRRKTLKSFSARN
jgi:hypothetical protein